jgi:hypothetical protein
VASEAPDRNLHSMIEEKLNETNKLLRRSRSRSPMLSSDMGRSGKQDTTFALLHKESPGLPTSAEFARYGKGGGRTRSQGEGQFWDPSPDSRSVSGNNRISRAEN